MEKEAFKKKQVCFIVFFIVFILNFELPKKILQEDEKKKREEEIVKTTEEMLVKRREYQEKTKAALLIEMPSEGKPSKKGRGRKDEYSDSGRSGDEEGAPREPG